VSFVLSTEPMDPDERVRRLRRRRISDLKVGVFWMLSTMLIAFGTFVAVASGQWFMAVIAALIALGFGWGAVSMLHSAIRPSAAKELAVWRSIEIPAQEGWRYDVPSGDKMKDPEQRVLAKAPEGPDIELALHRIEQVDGSTIKLRWPYPSGLARPDERASVTVPGAWIGRLPTIGIGGLPVLPDQQYDEWVPTWGDSIWSLNGLWDYACSERVGAVPVATIGRSGT